MAEETTSPRKRLREIVQGFDMAMFVTHSAQGVWARPMTIAEVTDDDVLYFATDIGSAKVNQVKGNPRASVILQDDRKYVSLSGTVSVLQDRALIDRLWSEAWRAWFTRGKDDPSLCLLAFDAEEGEYWDSSGINGLKYMLKAAKAIMTGTRPGEDAGVHGRTRL
jgi:general stress protein 26